MSIEEMVIIKRARETWTVIGVALITSVIYIQTLSVEIVVWQRVALGSFVVHYIYSFKLELIIGTWEAGLRGSSNTNLIDRNSRK